MKLPKWIEVWRKGWHADSLHGCLVKATNELESYRKDQIADLEKRVAQLTRENQALIRAVANQGIDSAEGLDQAMNATFGPEAVELPNKPEPGTSQLWKAREADFLRGAEECAIEEFRRQRPDRFRDMIAAEKG